MQGVGQACSEKRTSAGSVLDTLTVWVPCLYYLRYFVTWTVASELTYPPPHANGPPMPMPPPSRKLMDPPSRKKKHAPPLRFCQQIAHKLPFFAQFPECDIVCLMPNSPPCFALLEFAWCCARKQRKGLVRVF